MITPIDFDNSSELFVVGIFTNMEDISRLLEDAKRIPEVKINRSRTDLILVEGLYPNRSFLNQFEYSISSERCHMHPSVVPVL